MHVAARNGHETVVEMLIKAGADVNAVDSVSYDYLYHHVLLFFALLFRKSGLRYMLLHVMVMN